DTGLGLEALRRGIVAVIDGGDAVAGVLQPAGDGCTDAARSSRDDGDFRHASPPHLEPAPVHPALHFLRCVVRRPGSAFDAHGDAHAAPDAQRGETLVDIPALHLMEQGYEDARARGADRVPDRDGAAIDVDDVRV